MSIKGLINIAFLNKNQGVFLIGQKEEDKTYKGRRKEEEGVYEKKSVERLKSDKNGSG
jgi:hypothetical protein